MTKKLISIVFAIFSVATVAGCGAEIVLAQDAGTLPPTSIDSAPPQSDSGGSLPPPSDRGNIQGGMMPPPPPVEGGNGEPQRMPPPPLREGEFISPTGGEMRPPEMLGRPVEQGGMGRPPEQGGSENGQYKAEYQKQYNEEAQRQMEQRTREMRQKYAPGGADAGNFGPNGQPFQTQGKDKAQGRPFMGERQPSGRPFEEGQDFGGPQGGFGGEMMGGYGEGDEGGGADSEEREKMMEEREKQMQQEQLKQMKRGMVSGMERGLKQISGMIAKLSKKNIPIPADAQSLVTELTTALETVKAATEFTEEVENAMEVIQEKGQDLGDVGQTLGMLERMSQMTKQVSKEFAKLDKELVKIKKSKSGSQHPEPIARVERELSALKAEWQSVQSSVASGEADGDDLRDTMDEFFEKVGEVRRGLEFVKQLGSISKMMKSADKEIAMAEKEIARQKKAGNDVTRLNELLAKAKAKLSEAKALTAESNYDPEALFSLMQELRQIGDEAHDELDRVSGKAETNKLGASVLESLQHRRLGF